MQETRETPKEVYNVRVHFASLVACFAAVIIGYDAGFIGGTVVLPEFQREFGFANKSESDQILTKANIISLFHVGAFFGAYLIYPVGIVWGRIVGFIISGALLVFGSAIQLAANSERGLGPMLAGRVISGLGIGAVSNLAPMYVSEIAPPAIRGRLIGMYEVAWQVGGVIGFFINYGTEINLEGNRQWLVPVALQCIPSGLFFVGVFFIKESPRWYYTRGNKKKALESLSYLRNLDADSNYIAYEIAAMEEELIHRDKTVGAGFFDPFKALFGRKNLAYRLLLSTSIFMFQNTSGVNAINYYSVSILLTMGISSQKTGLLSTGIFGVIKGVCCFLWAFFVVDKFGRKVPVILISTICALCLWYIGVYIKVAQPEAGDGSLDAGGKAALAFFYIWTIGYAFSWSGTPWVYISEIFDLSVRTLAQCINASSNWFWAFILARFTQDMINSMQYGIFFFFASLLMISNAIYFFAYPETKNIPITDVDLLFQKGVRPWKAHAHVLKLLKEQEDSVLADPWSDKASQQFVEIVEGKEQV
ncbi:uncharacterized protein PRCAT00000012001 [Priceomyces carsonii]|uniref:uncharacterized protein n=1 Tax=Priceomyces carsonii TaxID=28549 RepID=UPI002ED931FE|nr:unnamed protein product [Priceomyces carsonii]